MKTRRKSQRLRSWPCWPAVLPPYTGESQAGKAGIYGGIGAATGAVIGAATSSKKDRTKGALIGAAVGGAAGGGYGYYVDTQ